jgi:hypothetical protein
MAGPSVGPVKEWGQTRDLRDRDVAWTFSLHSSIPPSRGRSLESRVRTSCLSVSFYCCLTTTKAKRPLAEKDRLPKEHSRNRGGENVNVNGVPHTHKEFRCSKFQHTNQPISLLDSPSILRCQCMLPVGGHFCLVGPISRPQWEKQESRMDWWMIDNGEWIKKLLKLLRPPLNYLW